MEGKDVIFLSQDLHKSEFFCTFAIVNDKPYFMKAYRLPNKQIKLPFEFGTELRKFGTESVEFGTEFKVKA